MSRFILVPGGNHGGWWYEPLVLALEKAGQTADALTLSGLDPEGPPSPGANLDMHIAEVAALGNSTSGLAVAPCPSSTSARGRTRSGRTCRSRS